MREKIIKLLKSENPEDKLLGREFLKKFYKEEIFTDTLNIAVLFGRDLNRILNTNEFKTDWPVANIPKQCIVLFKDDSWDMV